jgi:hypothetical protein
MDVKRSHSVALETSNEAELHLNVNSFSALSKILVYEQTVSAGHLLPEETAVTLTECYWETLLAL